MKSSEPNQIWRPSGITIVALLLVIALMAAAAFFTGYGPWQQRQVTVQAEAREQEKRLPKMDVMRAERAGAKAELKLPGTMQAAVEVPILARIDGYLKSRTVDIGDHVKAGQILAEIDAPELDQSIRQAEAAVDQVQAAIEQAQANLEQGRANRELAGITATRYKALADQGVAPRQESDQYQAQLAAQGANVQALEKAILAQRSNLVAAQANVARLKEISGYRSVKAPFDGVVTVRNVDAGALVSTGNTLLFRIAQTETLRTYVNVPQASANAIHNGQSATISVSTFPSRVFKGTVARMANALDPSSRTMLVEVSVPNADGKLLPGMFVDVDLSTLQPNAPLVLPAQALVIRTDGAQVAIVNDDGTIHLQKVVVGRDYGDRVEVLQGLKEGTTIVASPGDVAREGTKIEPSFPASR